MEHHLTTYITHDTLISALGFGTQENLEAIRSYHSGITLQTDKRIADTPLLAATLSQERLQQQAEAIGVSGYPRMEQLFILTINELIRQSRTNFGRQNLRTHPLHHQREHRFTGPSYGTSR